MKNLFTIALLTNLWLAPFVYSQCTEPITIPKADPVNGLGGVLCLEKSRPQDYDICLKNAAGELLVSKTVSEYIGSNLVPLPLTKMKLGDKQLLLGALLDQNTYFDLSFDHRSAGKSVIRSKRGVSWGTELQFRTNPEYAQVPLNEPDRENYESPVRMVIDSDGLVGINTEQPNYILDVYGIAKFCNENDKDSKLVIKGSNDTNEVPETAILHDPKYKRDLSFEFVGAGSSMVRSFRGGYLDTYLQFLTNPRNNSRGGENDKNDPIVRMQINEDGKVFIGDVKYKANQPYKLYVEGGILTEKVKVAVLGNEQWSDHVFSDDYKLKSLYDVEKYINKNKHLPNIPSADQLVNEGLDLAEMQSKQMEKIEELTLYLIEIRKELDLLKKENVELKKQVILKK